MLKRYVSVILLLGLMISVFSSCVFYSEISPDVKDTVIVPNLIGMTIDEISDEYPDYNFTIKYEKNAEKEEGVIFKQTPSAGREIKKTQEITITVAY